MRVERDRETGRERERGREKEEERREEEEEATSPFVDGDCKVMVGREVWGVAPLRAVEEPPGRGEEEGGREGDTTGVVLYLGRPSLLSFLLALSCGVLMRLREPGVLAGSSRGLRG